MLWKTIQDSVEELHVCVPQRRLWWKNGILLLLINCSMLFKLHLFEMNFRTVRKACGGRVCLRQWQTWTSPVSPWLSCWKPSVWSECKSKTIKLFTWIKKRFLVLIDYSCLFLVLLFLLLFFFNAFCSVKQFLALVRKMDVNLDTISTKVNSALSSLEMKYDVMLALYQRFEKWVKTSTDAWHVQKCPG